ncbi:hypothetical protein MCC93_25500 [Morococcus cerebrosus]|uniref:Uncharacterized protein n=1 Tax=Morococcus cerebrosus TaxID=1056807 RepID=A0A0C1GH62_9NEIS|nr:hypothetical protein MCC93_25500 [Morococcus cerebrosus]
MVGSQSGERLGLYWKGRLKTLNQVSDDLLGLHNPRHQ